MTNPDGRDDAANGHELDMAHLSGCGAFSRYLHRALPCAIGSLPCREKQLVTIDDGDEFTVILPESLLDDLPPLIARSFQAEYGYRFVHLEATLPWDTVGYGAAIFAALASAGLSAGFYSGYSIDYLLVRDADLSVALAALEMLITQAQLLPQRQP